MSAQVSVIVVAYNAEGSLARCLDSIISQSFSDIELILVDDGSKDRTASIADGYALKDPRIKVVRLQHGGVSKARQRGLDEASGDYSIFVDSDDWIEGKMIELMYDRSIQDAADIVFCDYVEENGLGIFYREQNPGSSDSKVVLPRILDGLHGSLCNKLIKMKLYKDSGIKFIDGINYCEDECVVIPLLNLNCKVSYVNQALYHYDKTANCDSVSNMKVCRPLEEYKLYIDTLSPYFKTPELLRVFDNRVAAIIKQLTYAESEDYQECRIFFLEHKDALMRSNLPLSKKAFCILYFNGFRFLSSIRESYQLRLDNKHSNAGK